MVKGVDQSEWVVRFRPNPNARLRLFCFPFAGGGTLTYRAWPNQLAGDIELYSILLPGREKRIRETPISDMMSLVTLVTDQLAAYLNKPFAFFGHSMGTILSMEVARELRRRQLPQPSMLMMSGCSAPHLPPAREPIYHLPDDRFLAAMQERYQRLPMAVIENEELRALFLPMLRADFTKVDTYQHQSEPPLNCPIVVFGGLQDDVSEARLSAWSQHTTAAFDLHMLPGDHFFINSSQAQLLKLVNRYLSPRYVSVLQ